MFFDRLVAELGSKGFSPVGATPEELTALARTLSLHLPQAYIEFLARFGQDHDGLWRGSDIFVDDVPRNLEVATALLRGHGLNPSVLDGAIVWFTHQGYIASWFHPSEAADPAAFLFSESALQMGVHSPGTFSELANSDAFALLGTASEHA